MAGERTLKVTVLGDSSGAQKALKQLGDHSDDAERRVGGLGSRLAGLGSVIAAGGAGLAVAGFFNGAFEEAEQARLATAQTEAVLRSTAGAANITADGISNLAGKLSALTGIDDEAIQSNENLLLTFTNIKNRAGEGNDIFAQATKTVLDMSVALGQDGKSSAIQLGKALNDPIAGITALTRVGVTFTDQQKAQIKTLVESGDTLGAQKIILKELNTEFGGSAEAAASPMKKLGIALDNLKEKVGTAFLPVLSQVAEALPGVIDKLSVFGDAVVDAIGPAFERVVTWFKENWPEIQKTAGEVVDWFKSNVGPAVKEVAEFLVKEFDQVVTWVRENWPQISEAIDHVSTVVGEIFEHLATIIGPIWDNIKGIVEGAIKVIEGVLVTVMAIINGDWGKAWEGIETIVGGVWDIIKNLVGGAIDLLAGIVSTGMGIVAGIFTGIWDGITEAVGEGVRFIVDKFLAMAEWVVKAADSAFGWVPGLGDNLHDAAQAVERFRDEVNAALGGIQDKVVQIKIGGSPIVSGPLPAGVTVQGKAFGGVVGGFGSGDTVPAMLTPGEFVMRKSAVDHIGVASLASMNRFGSGGLVGGGDGIDYDRLARAIAQHSRGDVTVNYTGAETNPQHLARELAWALAG